jgi:hypothetical protein
MIVVGNGKQFKMVFHNQKEQLLLFLPQTQKIRESSNRGLFCSTDTGLAWGELDVSWSKEYLSQHPWALAVKGQD